MHKKITLNWHTHLGSAPFSLQIPPKRHVDLSHTRKSLFFSDKSGVKTKDTHNIYTHVSQVICDQVFLRAPRRQFFPLLELFLRIRFSLRIFYKP